MKRKNRRRAISGLFWFTAKNLPIEALFELSVIILAPFLVGMDPASNGAGCAADNRAGAYGMLAADRSAYEATSNGAANQATNDLRGACLVVCIVAGHSIAIPAAGGIGSLPECPTP